MDLRFQFKWFHTKVNRERRSSLRQLSASKNAVWQLAKKAGITWTRIQTQNTNSEIVPTGSPHSFRTACVLPSCSSSDLKTAAVIQVALANSDQ